LARSLSRDARLLQNLVEALDSVLKFGQLRLIIPKLV
jgi:hypothetical protein